MQAVVSIIQKYIVSIKVPLWWQPVEGQTRGCVAYDGEIINSRWTYNRHILYTYKPVYVLKEDRLRHVYIYTVAAKV